MPFSRYSTFSDGKFACFCHTFCIQKVVQNRYNSLEALNGITFDIKQVALKFQKPLAGENLSFIQIYFKYYKIIGCHGNL